ncbi:hypothetical protein [Chrysiogenes arsenatis]|uniref:hypothetical protein n=1 Tax=Chrysiogenes arsenatis TaxID=309797 RepID=UPI00040C32F6|nr:hypothetical protein [Chrysiogenes arsenatis]
MLEGIPLAFVSLTVSTLGLPGMAVVFWYVDQRRTERMLAEHKAQLDNVLKVYRADMDRVTRYYEDNVSLVKGYERLAEDLSGVITLSTRTLEAMVQKIEHNQWCPAAREGVGKR